MDVFALTRNPLIGPLRELVTPPVLASQIETVGFEIISKAPFDFPWGGGVQVRFASIPAPVSHGSVSSQP